MVLTDAFLRSLEPPKEGQKFYFDTTLTGFALRISQGGSKSFVVKFGTDRRLVTIGRYPILSLSKAREEAKRILAEHTLGKIRPQSITYDQAVELFIKDKSQAARPSTTYSYERLLKRFNFKGQLADISHEDAARKWNRVASPSERSHMLVAGKVFFNWAIKRRYLDHNPLIGLTKPHSEPRTRVLTDTELRAIWKATTEPTHFHCLIRLALLTGQRRGELSKLKPEMIEGDICTIPAHISKNRVEHFFPLGALAQATLEKYPFVPFNNWSQAKEKLDKDSGVTGYTVHDLRRSFATRLAALEVPPHVIEAILGHLTGSLSQIARVYNRHSWLPQMRDAISKYERMLQAVILNKAQH